MENTQATVLQQKLKKISPSLRALIVGDALSSFVTALSKNNSLGKGEVTIIKNALLFTLLGDIEIENLYDVLISKLSLPEEKVKELLSSINNDFFTAQIRKVIKTDKEKNKDDKTENKEGDENATTSSTPTPSMKVLSVGNTGNSSGLRTQILEDGDTHKKTEVKKELIKTPFSKGSRDELLEKMDVLQAIPKSEEVADRLAKIQGQIKKIKDNEETLSKMDAITLEHDIANISKKVVARKEYDEDPYREGV